MILCVAMLHRTAMKWSNGWWVGGLVVACVLRLDAAVAPQDFKLRGIGIGMTRAEVEKIGALTPVEKESKPKVGLECCSIAFAEGMPSRVRVKFLDGKVSEINGTYSKRDLSEIGGAEKLLELLVERLGPATELTKGEPKAPGDGEIFARWTMPEASRETVYYWTQVGPATVSYVLVKDMAALSEIKKRRNASVIGLTDFKLRGVAMGMTPADVAKLGTVKEQPSAANTKIGKQEAIVMFDTGAPSMMSVTFLDGKLITLLTIYRPREVKELGGEEKLFDLLQDKIGEPQRLERYKRDPDSGKTKIIAATWFLEPAKRMVTYTCSDEGKGVQAKLVIYDGNGMDEMLKRERGGGPGF